MQVFGVEFTASMSKMLQQLSKIDNRTTDTVNGWIRMQERSLSLTTIPPLIHAICILFYRDDEYFKIIGDLLNATEDKKSVELAMDKLENQDPSRARPGCYKYSAYGLNQIPSNSNCTYNWEISVKEVGSDNAAHIFIGISSMEDYENGEDARHEYCNNGQIMHRPMTIKGGHYQGYGVGDIISVRLDMRQSEMTFIKNGQLVAQTSIKINEEKNLKYRLYVCCLEYAKLEIVTFAKE